MHTAHEHEHDHTRSSPVALALPSPSPPSPAPIPNSATASLRLLPQLHPAAPALPPPLRHCRCPLSNNTLPLPRAMLVVPRVSRVVAVFVVRGGLPQVVVVATKAPLPGMTVNAASTSASTRSRAGEQGGDRAVIDKDDAHHGVVVAVAAVAAAARARFMTTRGVFGFQKCRRGSSSCAVVPPQPRTAIVGRNKAVAS